LDLGDLSCLRLGKLKLICNKMGLHPTKGIFVSKFASD